MTDSQSNPVLTSPPAYQLLAQRGDLLRRKALRLYVSLVARDPCGPGAYESCHIKRCNKRVRGRMWGISDANLNGEVIRPEKTGQQGFQVMKW